MKTLVRVALSLIMAIVASTIVFVRLGNAVAAADDDQAVLKADRSLVESLKMSDKAAVDKLLDAGFEWTDVHGKTRTKADVLADLASLATTTQTETEPTLHHYGEVALILGINQNPRFSHIWVKRGEAWKAFIFFYTPMPAPGTAPAVSSTKDCDNPCKTIPHNPATEADRQVLASWQKQKMAEWNPDTQTRLDDWEKHASDDLIIFIPSLPTRTKADRFAELVKQKQEGTVVSPGGPVDSMRMYDYPDVVIYTAQMHRPHHPEKRYYSVRVWVKRDDVWKIALSQQTDVQTND